MVADAGRSISMPKELTLNWTPIGRHQSLRTH